MHSFPQTSVCGKHPQRSSRGLLDFCPAATWFQVWASDHTGTVDCPLPGRGLGGCRATLVGYGICIGGAKPCHGVQMGLWPNCHVGSSLSSSPPHSGGGSLRNWCCWWMKSQTGHMPSCGWMTLLSSMCPCPVKDMLALWQMLHPAQMPAAVSINCRCENYCKTGAGWYAQKG